MSSSKLSLNQELNFFIIYTDKSGEIVYRMIWSKGAKGFRLRKVYQDKTFLFRQVIKENVLKRAKYPTKRSDTVSLIIL